MMTRREALAVLGSMAVGTLVVPTIQGDATPPLAPGAPDSPERLALINAFRAASEKIPEKFEARTYKSDFTMPYRLFRPNATGRLPLVVYLHGSGGQGTDNEKQMGLAVHGRLGSLADGRPASSFLRARSHSDAAQGGRPPAVHRVRRHRPQRVGWAYTEPALVRWVFSKRRA